jgi:AmmeMemoRadiSam system protein B
MTAAAPLTSRPAAVAGLFYPADATELAQTVDRLVNGVPQRRHAPPKALIVPHAGYVYSAPFAAPAYALLRGCREQIRRVVLLGPAHRVRVDGIALPTCAYFVTPLGQIPVDQAACQQLRQLTGLPVVDSDLAHASEHSLEVQLPFLQRTLGAFDLVPLAIGLADPTDVATCLEALWGGPETLIVISSDLSHYLPAARAREHDGKAAQRILQGQPTLHGDDACGAIAINGLLLQAQRHGLEAEQLSLGNSADTAGGPDRVVGYAAFAFTPEPTLPTGHA